MQFSGLYNFGGGGTETVTGGSNENIPSFEENVCNNDKMLFSGQFSNLSRVLIHVTLRTFGIYSMSDAPEFVIYIYNHFDAFLHAIEYGILTWCMLMYFHTIRYTVRQTIRAYVGAFFFAGIIGFLNELWQMHVPHRSPSGSDVLANFIGAALFIGLFHFIKMRKVKNVS